VSKKKIFLVLFFVATSRCSTLFNDYDEKVLENKEFDANLKVQEMAPVESPKTEVQPNSTPVKQQTTTKEKPLKQPPLLKAPPTKSLKHEPDVEDGEGFIGRRPKVDPFVENEELSYAVSYFAVEAGRFTMKTHPFVQVNGRKSYRFTLHARSSSVFSVFYAVDDMAESFLDYEELIPYSYTIKAKESKQVRDVKSFFNWKTMQAKTWDKKIKKGKEPEEKIYEWEVLPFSQNVFSAAFYMRCFHYEVGKQIAIRVGHEGKNIIMTAKILRQEKLKTEAGTFDTFVIKPEFEIDGVFKPIGDIFMWITNDSYHRIARIESKIKIGKIVVNLQKISP
jgi:Protein of unknown function (DUF3108)